MHKNHSPHEGNDFYALRLKSYTTTDYSAEEIHQIGLAEVARIENRMRDIFVELGYEINKPIGEMMSDLNEDPEFLYADTPAYQHTKTPDLRLDHSSSRLLVCLFHSLARRIYPSFYFQFWLPLPVRFDESPQRYNQ